MGLEFKDAKEAASFYVGLGWYPIPLTPKTKECRDADWRTRVYTPDEFDADGNIGIRLVKESDVRQKKLVGIDLDCQEAVDVALAFLPESDAVWGRETKELSQILYLSPFERPVTYKEMTRNKEGNIVPGQTLVEIRVDHQSMAPPSIHPNGEKLSWKKDRIEPSAVEHKVLLRAAQMVATAALTARFYPAAGSRHDWCLALAGAFKLFGLTEDEAVALVTAAMKVAGDTKTKDRKLEIRTTYARSDDEPTAGLNKLVESMGEEKGKLFVESLRKIWAEKSPFRTDDRGKKVIANDQANVRRALNKMEVKVYKDEFSYRLLVRRGADPPEYYTDDVRNRLWLELDSRFHFRPSLEFFEIVLKNSAEGNSVHPVREYLESLKWDETPRIDGWLSAYGGAKTNDYVKAVGTIILIAAVKRVMEPGCKFDELLVLESPQGHNKSTMLRTLCPHENWFSDDLPLGVDSKLVIERTAGKWIVEAQELMNMRRTQVEHLKSFLSRQTDGPVRLAYERNSRELQRQFIIIGTTNASTYLKDQTGNRRFWPVRVKLFQVGKIAQDRDQLWAEAFKRYKDGESIRLKTSLWAEAGKLQESRRTIDPWEDKIDALVAGLPSDSDKQRVDPEEVWSSLGISLDRRSTQDGERIAALLERHGFRRMSVRGKDGKVMKGWGRDLVDGIWKPGGWE